MNQTLLPQNILPNTYIYKNIQKHTKTENCFRFIRVKKEKLTKIIIKQ